MEDIRYIFCDLDGTLLNNAKEPSMKTMMYLRELKKKRNIQVGIATGRAPSSVLPMMKKFGIEDIIDVMIANNGVDTLNGNEMMHNQKLQIENAYENHLHKEGMVEVSFIKQIINVFAPVPYVDVCFHNPQILYATGTHARVTSILKMNGLHLVNDPRKCHDYEAAPRVMLLFHPLYQPLVEELVKHHPIEGLKGYFAEPDIYEFSNQQTSKHKAIRKYVEKCNGTLQQVMVFGDSENDIGMLKACGMGVVMQNADEHIKKVGDKVTAFSNEQDGIFEFLRNEFGE